MEVLGHDLCNPRRAEVIQAGMNDPSKPHIVISWVLRLTVAGILLQTLFFKFTGADESVCFARSAIRPPRGSGRGDGLARPSSTHCGIA